MSVVGSDIKANSHREYGLRTSRLVNNVDRSRRYHVGEISVNEQDKLVAPQGKGAEKTVY